MRRMAFEKKKGIKGGFDDRRKIFKHDMTKTGRAKRVKTENDIVWSWHYEKVTSEYDG